MRFKRMGAIKALLIISLLLCTSNNVQAVTKEFRLTSNTSNVPIAKAWKITFNQAIENDSLSNNVLVKDSNGALSNIKINLDNTEKVLTINPPKGGYKYNEIYSLNLTDKIKSRNGQPLKKNVVFNFNTQKEPIIPKISYLSLSKEPLIEGEKGEVYIAAKNAKEVQYRVFIYDKQLSKYQEVTKGYTEPKKTNTLFKIGLLNSLKKGEYDIKVYVKNPNIKGIHTDYNTEFDSCETLQFSCLGNSEEEINGDINTELSDYKIGQIVNIRGLENLNKKNDLYEYEFKVYNLANECSFENIPLDNDKINWKPEKSGEYILEISMRGINENSYKTYKAKKVKCIIVNNNVDNNDNSTNNNTNNNTNNSTNNNTNNNTNNSTNNNTNNNKSVIYNEYVQTINDIVKIQLKNNSVIYANEGFNPATSDDIVKYVEPKQFERDEYAIFQFLKLNYVEGTSIEELNEFLKGKGVLDNKGDIFLKAAENNDVSVEYLVSHAILETGHGKSKLASGISVEKVNGKPVEPKTTYNMFGIGAYDIDANRLGAEYAYKCNWFTVDDAIIGGAKWISDNYINNTKYKQNTLYKMRWNPTSPGVHQYATDVAWAYKQIKIIKPLIDKCENYKFNFEIPKYKE